MKPNILYMHTHDSGRYWSPYGHAVPAPNLMRLADDSTLFRHCYSAAPTCSPSRAALLTGMSPHACGMTGLAHRGFRLNDYSRHLAPFLGRQGYRTALCGIQHEAPDAGMIGYHELLGGIHDDMHLISPIVIEPIQALKLKHLGNHNPRLHSDEILIALSICAATNPTAELALRQLPKLRGCEAHSSVILSSVDSATYRKLGINLTCEPQYQTKKLFHR